VADDSPSPCAGPNTFCVSWVSNTTNGLIEVDANNGQLLQSIPNVERVLGSNLYQTDSLSTILLQIGRQGNVLWQSPASSIFGPVSDTSNYGWNIDAIGDLNVGTLSSAPSQNSLQLGAFTTSGFSIASGRPLWTDPGVMYNCEGTLEIFSPPVLCRFSGSVLMSTNAAQPDLSSGASVRIEGFDAQTGKISWSRPDEDLLSLLAAGNLPFVDAHRIVVKIGGSYQVLDLATGDVQPVQTNQVFWCAITPFVKVVAPAGSVGGDLRAATDQFNGCNAAGNAVPTHPTDQPSIVGITVNHRFFWPTPHGLDSEPAI
jgi:hypothetical protein